MTKDRAHRSTIALYPKSERFGDDEPRGQYTYSGKALASVLPHGADHDCLMCSDMRAALGHVALDPDPRLTEIGRRILARAAERDGDRIRLAPGVRLPVWPTLVTSAFVGALFGVTLALWLLP